MNLFHLEHPEPPERLLAVIEVPRGSKNKYEYDISLGILRLSRVSHSPFSFPFDYGFIPGSWTEENSPLDVVVLSQQALFPLTVVEVAPIGALDVYSRGKADPKLICVAISDPVFCEYSELEELPSHLLEEFIYFFEHYREMEGREIVVRGKLAREEAMQVVLQCISQYQERFQHSSHD